MRREVQRKSIVTTFHRRATRIVLVTLTLFVSACHDLTSSDRRLVVPTPRADQTWTASIPVDPVTGAGAVDVATFDSLTLVEVTVNGTVRAIPSSGPIAYEWGPTGYYWESASVVRRSSSGVVASCAWDAAPVKATETPTVSTILMSPA